ncbi:carboxylesterase family protein [Flavobacterium degerlachei]|jgi:predicted peptidase|uniref:Phospholipase/Carboxylesterase n=1 Tax=Flavobacterium degerlachei TaxID=229203 RepID=A0A1H2U7D8_9FLAO|nr:alpha/beta hydrolase-fold protein [Flavobacterium degerlachei]SDW51509.1 Phospholipase/Carboxylesterase [Flavobacterium degerlachei]
MNNSKKIYVIVAIVSLLFGLFSCNSSNPKFGKRFVAKDSDTISLQKLKGEIRSVSNTVFEIGSYTGSQNIPIHYRLLKPKLKREIDKFPLVIVFHGSAAIGTDNESQLGLLAKLWAVDNIQKKYPAYVLAPQFSVRSSNYSMDKNRAVIVSVAQGPVQTTLQLIDSLKANLNIDSKRIYLVGFSMGASTVINTLSSQPDLFAAVVSIAGIPQFDQIGALANKPIWLIHGNQDTENPFESDMQFYKESSMHNKTLFWEMDALEHNNILSTELLGDAIPKWLFRFSAP